MAAESKLFYINMMLVNCYVVLWQKRFSTRIT